MEKAQCESCKADAMVHKQSGLCEECDQKFLNEWYENIKDMRDNGWDPLSNEY